MYKGGDDVTEAKPRLLTTAEVFIYSMVVAALISLLHQFGW